MDQNKDQRYWQWIYYTIHTPLCLVQMFDLSFICLSESFLAAHLHLHYSYTFLKTDIAVFIVFFVMFLWFSCNVEINLYIINYKTIV